MQTAGRLARKVKRPDDAVKNSLNHGKTAHNRRRNLTLIKEPRDKSDPPQVKKKSSQDQVFTRKAFESQPLTK